MKLKPIALLLAVVLLFSCLTACGEAAPAEEQTEQAEETAAPAEETEADAEAADKTVPTRDYAAAYAKYDPNAVVFTVNGAEVKWSEYFAWLYSVIEQIASYYGITDWNTELEEGYTCQDYILEYAQGMSSEYAFVHQKADELGVKLTDEDLATIDATIQADADEYYGGDLDALYAYLEESYYTKDYYRFMTEAALLYQDIFESYFGAEGSKVSDEDVYAWLEDAGYIYTKHILLKCIDDAGNALDDAALEEKADLAVDLVKQLQNCKDDEREALFDKLMNEYSDDTGLALNPDGYYFLPGEMVETFELAAKALEKNTVPGVVQSDYGLHILYQNGMNPEHVFTCDSYGNPITVRYQAANELFSQITAQWTEEMEAVFSPEFENLNLDELFGTV